MSSCLKYSTAPEPSLKTSEKQTSPASLMWSFRSCQLPVAGSPLTITRYWDLYDNGWLLSGDFELQNLTCEPVVPSHLFQAHLWLL